MKLLSGIDAPYVSHSERDRYVSKVCAIPYAHSVRIERTGTVEPLTPLVVRFLTRTLGGVALDDIQSPEAARIDYSCLRGLLAVELKTLEEPGTERMDNLTDELRQRDDWPLFLGSAPMQAFINNTNDPGGVARRVMNRIGRAIINHLKKANRQLEAHSADFPRRNLVRLLLMVNEDHEIYDPHTVAYILGHAVQRTEGECSLYDHIDGIIFLTQRHATIKNNRLTYPILTVEGAGCHDLPWKADVLALVAERWAAENKYIPESSNADDEFVAIDHIPEVAPRHERWRTEYRRNPYLRGLTKEQLRDRFDENALLCAWGALKDPPVKLPKDQWMAAIRRFGDFMLEMGERAIPITEFPWMESRERTAAQRLRLPRAIIDWMASIKRT